MSSIENNINLRSINVNQKKNISEIDNSTLHKDETSIEENINNAYNIKKDQLELSDKSHEMNNIALKTKDILDQIDEVEDKMNSSKIDEIKNRVRNGFYQTDGVISNVIDRFLDEAIFDATI